MRNHWQEEGQNYSVYEQLEEYIEEAEIVSAI